MKNSASSLKTYARCPKLWEFTYVDVLEPIDSGSFEASYGRSYHACQEGADNWEGSFGAKWQRIIWSHYESHQAYWKARKEWSDLEIGQKEVKFSFEIVPGKVIHGIVDGICTFQGNNYLIEYKTTGSKMDDWFMYNEHSVQGGLYLLAAQNAPELQQYNIQGIIYDVTKRCSLRQKKSEPDTDYIARCTQWWYDNREDVFERRIITRSTEYLYELEADVLELFDAQERKAFPRNRDSCYNFRRQCGWFDVCFGNEKKSNSELYQVRKRR